MSTFIDMLEQPFISDILAQTMCWIIGEYAYLAVEYDQNKVLEQVSDLLDNKYFQDDSVVKGWVLTALGKLVAHTGLWPAIVASRVSAMLKSSSADLHQRAAELLALVKQIDLMRRVLPCDASCEDIDVEAGLACLNPLVSAARARGAKPYYSAAERQSVKKRILAEEKERMRSAAFKFSPYERTAENPPRTAAPAPSPLFAGLSNAPATAAAASPGRDVEESHASFASGSVLNVATKRWGKGGDLARLPTPDMGGGPHAGGYNTESSNAEESVHTLLNSYSDIPAASPSYVIGAAPTLTFELSAAQSKKQQLANSLFGGGAPAANKPSARISKARIVAGGAGAGMLEQCSNLFCNSQSNVHLFLMSVHLSSCARA